jgi:hypothetical protein
VKVSSTESLQDIDLAHLEVKVSSPAVTGTKIMMTFHLVLISHSLSLRDLVIMTF